MYLSDRDLRLAIECGRLIVEPKPAVIDPTSIDLHLDSADEARIWNVEGYRQHNRDHGLDALEFRVAAMNYREVARRYQIAPTSDPNQTVFRRNNEIIVKQHGFLLWQTREEVGTPAQGSDLIAFVDGKSTRARAGLLVHMTAPTIHSGWTGKIVLEIGNLGPFDLVLREGDAIAQIIVAGVSYPPTRGMQTGVTFRQRGVGAQPAGE